MILRAGAVLTAAMAALALAACQSDDEGSVAAAPPNFQQSKTADFGLAVPDGWQVATRKVEGSNDEFVEARPPGTDVNRAELRAGAKRKYGGDINGASRLHSADIAVRRPGAKEARSEEIEVPGAADARRIEFTVPADAPLQAARIVTVLALSKARTLVNLTVGVAADDPANAQIDEIIRSLKLSS